MMLFSECDDMIALHRAWPVRKRLFYARVSWVYLSSLQTPKELGDEKSKTPL